MQACMYVLCRRRQAELLIPPLRVTTCLDVCVDGEPIRDTMSGSLGALSKEDGFVISGMPSSPYGLSLPLAVYLLRVSYS